MGLPAATLLPSPERLTPMHAIFRLAFFLKPYRKQSFAALLLLMAVVAMDLSIPRLIQRIIDKGIHQHNQEVVIHTGFLMLGISVLSVLFAVGNNILSVKVGECVARDLREALFLKIQSFSFGNIDRLKTGKLMVRLSSDVTAVQRVAQVSLRIGTRAPLLMIGSLILMIRTSSTLALTMLPLLFVTSLIIVFFCGENGAALPCRAAATRSTQFGFAGKYCRHTAHQGFCSQ